MAGIMRSVVPQYLAGQFAGRGDLALPSPLSFFERFRRVEAFERAFGPPREVASNSAYAGLTLHRWTLVLWPHLSWDVDVDLSGQVQGYRFTNPFQVPSQFFSPALVSPGCWTKSAIELEADSSTVLDGWDEWQTLLHRFGNDAVEATYSFDIVLKWRFRH
jgi:hypothetical protein